MRPHPEPRQREERKRDTLARLRDDLDLWVASAGEDGDAYLIPLSFYWDGETITVATPHNSPTAKNMARAGSCRIAVGTTRDVVMIDGTVEVIEMGVDPALEEAHAVGADFDARGLSPTYVYLRVTPTRIQAWREANEIPGRDLMREGEWLV
jgi:general stress protein 26